MTLGISAVKSPINVLCIDETKLNSSYPADPQLKILGYQYIPYRKDQSKYDGGKTVFLREGLIARSFKNIEGDTTETICPELTISKKIRFIIFNFLIDLLSTII